MKRLFAIVVALAAATAVFSQSRNVVASTGWTAAFIRSAGWTGPIRVLAPFDVAHPPEYELRASDLTALGTADLVVYAGYEVMVQRLAEAVGQEKLLRIATDHGPATIRASVLAIAERLGTTGQARENVADIERLIAAWKDELARKGLGGASVLTHALQAPLAGALGLKLTPFGPAPLEAARIRDLTVTGATLIVDNLHNPVGSPLKETIKGARYAVLMNFPTGDVSVRDILVENQRRLAQGWGL